MLDPVVISFLILAVSAVSATAGDVDTAYDLAIVGPNDPVPELVSAIGWDFGLTYGRIVHYDARGKYFWGTCPDDARGVCPPLQGATSTIHGYTKDLPNGVNHQRYQADFDIGGTLNACRPGSGEPTNMPGTPWNALPCPLYAKWLGSSGSRAYSVGVNNYSWNKWNSPNIWVGLEEHAAYSATLVKQRLDNVLLSLNLDSSLDRTMRQNGVAPRGQGRILVGFAFTGADGNKYAIEINLSNMRVNLTDQRRTSDHPLGAPDIPISNPWRDDIWAEHITSVQAANSRLSEYVVGARNWGFNFKEGQIQKILIDPWWVANVLMNPPATCPYPITLLNHGTATTSSYTDPNGYGVFPCASDPNALANALPPSALYDSNGQPTAHLTSFYAGVEVAGTAVHASAIISGWKLGSRW